MLYHFNKEVTDILYLSKNVVAIYNMSNLVWEGVTSCFGKGYWVANAPWSATDGWKQ